MINARATLERLDIDTVSPLRAVQKVGEMIRDENAGLTEANKLIKTITGVEKHYDDFKTALYVTQAIVETAVKNEMFDPEETIMRAEARATQLIADPKMQWAFAAPIETTEDGTTINVARGDTTQVIAGKEIVVKSDGSVKKGGKRIIVEELYKKHVLGENMSNQDFIKLIMKEAQLSKAGSTTYAYDCKQKFGRQTESVEQLKGPSKQDLASELYKKHVLGENMPKDKFIELIMTELNTSKAGATTYFYSSRKQSS